MIVHVTFWAAVALVLYAYFGYPCLLVAISLVRRRDCTRPPSAAATAHNEASRIAAKIENTLAQDYPGHLEIVVASDCSTDGTDDVVRGYAPRVRLVRTPERRG